VSEEKRCPSSRTEASSLQRCGVFQSRDSSGEAFEETRPPAREPQKENTTPLLETGREEKEDDSEINGTAARFGRRKSRSKTGGVSVVRKRDSGGVIWDENQKKNRETRNLAPPADQMKT
jgi:hypothetical protein